MPSFVPFIRWLLLLACCVVCSAPVAAGQNGQIATCGPCSLSGLVSDATTHARLDGVRLELNSTQGPSVGTFFTASGGTFYFSNLPAASYILVADKNGYETVSQQVDLFNEELKGLQIELRRTADSATPDKGPNTVSVRELSPFRAKRAIACKGDWLCCMENRTIRAASNRSKRRFKNILEYYEAHYAQMGVAYMKLADTANSEKAFQKSVRSEPSAIPGWVSRAC